MKVIALFVLRMNVYHIIDACEVFFSRCRPPYLKQRVERRQTYMYTQEKEQKIPKPKRLSQFEMYK